MFLKAAAAPFSKRRSRDCDSLVVSGPLTEEAQVAAVSGFLSFVPFQILKRTRQDSREIILRGQRAGEGNRTPVCSLGSCRSTIELHPRGDFRF